MKRFQCLCRRLFIGDYTIITLIEKSPQLLQEAVYAVDSISIPWLALLDRSKEHFIQTERIGSIALHNIVGIYYIKHRLRHLLNGISTHILAILKNKLGIVELRTPCAELVDIKNIVAHNVYIYVYRRNVVILLEIE